MTSRRALASVARRARAGFTLIELIIAIGLLALIIGIMYQALGQTIEKRNMVHDALRAPKVANAILAQIFKDFRYIYWGEFKGGAGFRGSAHTISGMDADRVAFVTARRTRTIGAADDGSRQEGESDSPLTEVGYACRPNPKYPQWLELWRREDYFVDSKPTDGGFYTLVYDKIRNFRMRYVPIPEEHYENKEGLEEWDSAVKKKIPYAILLKIEFDVSDPVEGEQYQPDDIDPIHRIILLRAGYDVERSDTQTSTAGPAMSTGPTSPFSGNR
jgi:prepilin-type N-terminal cleavage/methylation domain-containing protein